MDEVWSERQLNSSVEGYARFLTNKLLYSRRRAPTLTGSSSAEDQEGLVLEEAPYDVDIMWYAQKI